MKKRLGKIRDAFFIKRTYFATKTSKGMMNDN